MAQIVAAYLEHSDPARERCWIAALDGEPVGSVFCVDAGDGVAKLRLLIVDPAARGRHVGTQLVDECIRFARAVGYRELTLWTQRQLVALGASTSAAASSWSSRRSLRGLRRDAGLGDLAARALSSWR